jgi:nucleotide-binding universal stress UspA family protein
VEDNFVQLDHIVAAVDQSEEGRSALQAALKLGRHSGGKVTALTIEPPVFGASERTDSVGLGLRPAKGGESAGYSSAVRSGLPGVEIGRFAEEAGAGLVILGRKRRSTTQRLFLGDTADEAVRRSQLPCLSVRDGSDHEFTSVLAALDGSARGMVVLLAALDLSRCTGSRLRVLTVEPSRGGEVGSKLLPSTRSARLAQSVDRIRLDDDGGASWDPAGSIGDSPLVIRHGQVVEEILAEVTACGADVLVIGYHRGGPAGVIEAGSIARRVLHQAECAVLTVPL